MRTRRSLILLCLAMATSGANAAPALEFEFTHLASKPILPGGGEVVAIDTEMKLVASGYVTPDKNEIGVVVIDISEPGNPREDRRIRLTGSTRHDPGEITSTILDINDRGFGALAVVPKASQVHPGEVLFFDFQRGVPLGTVAVGFHPDAMAWVDNANYLAVANEGEFTTEDPQRPGSVTLIDMRGVSDTQSWPKQLPSHTIGFGSDMLEPGVSLEIVRTNREDNLNRRFLDIEPEFIAAAHAKAFVTLQENNAVAVLDIEKRKWEAIFPLGALPLTLDASDVDGINAAPRIAIDDSVFCLPMPDAITYFEQNGTAYFATANEGDSRPDDYDVRRMADVRLDPDYQRELTSIYGQDPSQPHLLGRLEVSVLDGDLDNDGDIDQLTVFGCRGFSIWNAKTGELVYSSGSLVERWTGTHASGTFNMNGGNRTMFDTRSDNRGPEAEALALFRLDGVPYLFVAMERQNGILMFDLSNPQQPEIVGYYNYLGSGDLSPETMLVIPAHESGLEQHLLLVGYEISHSMAVVGFNKINRSSRQ